MIFSRKNILKAKNFFNTEQKKFFIDLQNKNNNVYFLQEKIFEEKNKKKFLNKKRRG